MKATSIAAFASVFAGLISGCSAKHDADYSYPNYPYYVSREECGGASPARCDEARAQAKIVAGDAAAATWGSLVALTLLASVDLEPENGR